MQVLNPNNIKIYNLSAGKSLPEWITDRKKRALQKNDTEFQKRIELIQDFEMPICSTNIKATPDGQYIFAAGLYKPRIRCYDVSQLSMKFERCMDSEIVKFHILSEDYSKFVCLQNDRYIEIHAQQGRYYRTRIPKYGRDLAYHSPSCDMYFVAAGSEIYRLNLELGRFMTSLKTNSTEINCCEFNPINYLFTCGTSEGHLECWDPRTRKRVARIDCALNSFMQEAELGGIPAITSLKYRDALTMAIGTSTGQVLLYDLRSDQPLLMKDHLFGLPIKGIEFHDPQDLVLSTDSRILKLWDRNNAKAYTSIEPGTVINDLCLLKDTGLLFMANEDPKMQAYYIPSLGAAPKWCSFLDNLTEELEENPPPSVYDDYKFVSRTELESLGLSHLIGSNLLRAYMHGYFMDIRLYRKAKSIADPFAYDEYRKNKIQEKIEEERTNRVKVQKLPKVNRQLAEKLLEQEIQVEAKKKSKKQVTNILQDERFAKMFTDTDYQVDMESEEYRLLNPLVSKLDKDRKKKYDDQLLLNQSKAGNTENEPSDNEEEVEEDSSDDEHTWSKEVKHQHWLIKKEERLKRKQEEYDAQMKPAFYEMESNVKIRGLRSDRDKIEKQHRKSSRRSLGERVESEKDSGVIHQQGSSIGNMEMTFSLKKNAQEKKHHLEAEKHHSERRKIRRSACDIIKDQRQKPKFWMGKRVN
ncbi:hypothetical protein LSH36_62g05021 [Paralvinella palmiformis]|uniref:Nucleolar protein 10 n=1 Tax=Paralvinella palmiformis TaxID=53620 RepID=A0AAD9NC44_9ANNE|nr:hypothetical protein LSH36_62g05021 [Paralvinella palmiformis]